MKIKFIFLVLLVVGCNSPRVEKPENLIDKPIMEDILYDMSLINASRSVNPVLFNANEIITFDSFIFKKYKVDSLQLAKSSVYYASFPDEYAKIFEIIENRLKVIKDSLDEAQRIKNEEQLLEREKNKDSIIKTKRPVLDNS